MRAWRIIYPMNFARAEFAHANSALANQMRLAQSLDPHPTSPRRQGNRMVDAKYVIPVYTVSVGLKPCENQNKRLTSCSAASVASASFATFRSIE